MFKCLAVAVSMLLVGACVTNTGSGNERDPLAGSANSRPEQGVGAGSRADAEPTPVSPKTGPRTIRDFFTLLPEKYFTLEGCDRETDRGCVRAREEYLKTFTEVEDVRNGYFKGGCDGAQSCIEMAIFKRPDETYLVGVGTFAEMMNEFYFLDHANGEWKDVSADVVPGFSRSCWYELPRYGTTMRVFEKRIVEKTNEFEISEKGKLLYSLAWKDGKFTRAR